MMDHPSPERLSDHAEGLLGSAEERELDRHLSGCRACAEQVAEVRRMRAELASLPAGLTPERDLYPGIAARLRPAGEPSARRRRANAVRMIRYPLAAAAILLVVLTTAVNSLLMGRKVVPTSSAPSETAATALASESAGEGALATYLRLENEYAPAIDALTRALAERRDDFSPETLRMVEENLRLIDAALEESRAALAADPGNSAARSFAVAALEKKLDLLRSAARVRGDT